MRYVPTPGIGRRDRRREGVFLPCSFWLVEAPRARRPRRRRNTRCSNDCSQSPTTSACTPEEYDPDVPRLLGNFPQAFTHLALVAAAHTLEPETFAMTRDAATVRAPSLHTTDVRTAAGTAGSVRALRSHVVISNSSRGRSRTGWR